MLYDRSNIIDNFRGLIGFSPSIDSSNANAAVDSSFMRSDSGMYVDQLNPLFTAENFANSAPQFSNFVVAEWDGAVTYYKNSVVKRLNKIYVCLLPGVGSDPSTVPASWKKTTLLSVWFQSKYDAAVLYTIDYLMNQKKLEGHGRDLLVTSALYMSSGLAANTIAKSGRFVGYEVTMKQPDVMISIQRIGLQITAALSVPIHFIYNGTDTVVNINAANPGKFFNMDMPTPIPKYTVGFDTAIIGYYEADLGAASAINLKTEVFNNSCSTCGYPDSGQQKKWSPYIDVKPISIKNGVTTYENYTNFGLNLAISAKCDMSDLIIRHKDALAWGICQRLRVVLLEELSYNLRNNQQADPIGNYALAQLKDWDDPQNPTIEFKQAIKALSVDMSALNPFCVPCITGGRIKSRSI